MSELSNAVAELKRWRELQEVARTELEALQLELEKTDLYKRMENVKQVLKEYQEDEELARQSVLKLGMAQFDGVNKHPVKGVQVKEFKTTVILDVKKAMAWASQFLPTAIKLDEKAVGKAVEALDVDFVEKKSEFKANLVEKELAEYGEN